MHNNTLLWIFRFVLLWLTVAWIISGYMSVVLIVSDFMTKRDIDEFEVNSCVFAVWLGENIN